MFRYGLLLTGEVSNFAQLSLLRQSTKPLISQLRAASREQQPINPWVNPLMRTDDVSQRLAMLIQDLHGWFDAGLRFEVCRYRGQEDWQIVADWTTDKAQGNDDWQREMEGVSDVAAAVKRILSGQWNEDDGRLLKTVISTPLPDGFRSRYMHFSRALPLLTVEERQALTVCFDSRKLRTLLTVLDVGLVTDNSGST